MARRVEQIEGEPLMLEAITAEGTEMPRSRSTAIQSERTRRRSPRSVRDSSVRCCCCENMAVAGRQSCVAGT
jgi:hypothetical protein